MRFISRLGPNTISRIKQYKELGAKWIPPLFIAVMLIAFLTRFSNKAETPEENKPFEGTEVVETQLSGISSANNVYTVNADKIVQLDQNKYQLYSIRSKYYLDENKEEYIILISKDGVFNSNTNTIHLYNDVEIDFSKGYRLITERLDIDFDKMEMHTKDKVEINGVKGKIFAGNGLMHHMHNKNIYFYGPITSAHYGVSIDNSSAPIDISSNNLQINYDTKIVDYIDNVMLKQNNANMQCNKMSVHYLNDGSLHKIYFHDNVLISKDDKIAKGDFAELNSPQNLLTLTGNVALKENGGYIEGKKIVYNTKTGIFKISSNGDKNKDRIKIIITE